MTTALLVAWCGTCRQGFPTADELIYHHLTSPSCHWRIVRLTECCYRLPVEDTEYVAVEDGLASLWAGICSRCKELEILVEEKEGKP